MSRQKDVLCEIANAISAGKDFRTADWFTEDFVHCEPSKPDWPRGHAGARQVLEVFKTLTPPINLEPLDMVEEGSRVAVRWRLSASYNGKPVRIAIMSLCRFEGGRIAEDCRVSVQADWPECAAI